MKRRAILLALAASGCGGGDDGPVTRIAAGPPSYSHLTPLALDVVTLDIAPVAPGLRVAAAPPTPIAPSDAMLAMGRDRLSAAGREGAARFIVLAASLTRRDVSTGGLFSGAMERIDCVLRCRVEVRGPEDDVRGFAEAEVRRTATLPANNDSVRARNAESLVRDAMADMNVEFEFQLRRNLRAVLMDTERAPAPPSAVEQEALPNG